MKKLFTALICAMMVLGVGGCGSKGVDVDGTTDKLKESGYKIDITNEKLEISNEEYNFNVFYDENDVDSYSAILVFTKNAQAILTYNENDVPYIRIFNSDCAIEYKDANTDKYTKEECKVESELTDIKYSLEKELKSLDLNFDTFIDYVGAYVKENK